jgi:uncharacterized protein YggE
MKAILSLLATVFFVQVVTAQQPQSIMVNSPYPKTISVSGSAEMEVVPDEIFVNIVLTEYQKRGEAKKDLETIKAQFLDYCKQTGTADSLISIVFYSGYNNNSYYYIRKRNKNADLYNTITYQVKFRDAKLMDDLVDKLDDNATQSFQIVATSHSRINEFRKQLKIRAVQAAKEKGIYLTEAVGEKLGEPISIVEPAETKAPVPYNSYRNPPGGNASLMFKALGAEEVDNGLAPGVEVDFRKLKLRFEVNIVFALK